MAPITPDFFQFLVENRLHDSKPWFEAHRQDYERLVLTPLRSLVEDLSPTLLEVDSRLTTDPKIGKTISRIFRDTRFSKDKSIFREVMWVSFSRAHLPHQSVPTFFLELAPEGYTYGCGCYASAPAVMNTLRTLILTGDSDFLQAKKAMDRQSVFSMEGELYKRSKHPEASAELQFWLERKSLSMTCWGCEKELLFSPELGGRVAQDLALLAPFYQLLWKAQTLCDTQTIHPRVGFADW